jgi:hypothetical protein
VRKDEQPAGVVNLGFGTYVMVGDVVGWAKTVGKHMSKPEEEALTLKPYVKLQVGAIVLLRNGATVAAHCRPETVARRTKRAQDEVAAAYYARCMADVGTGHSENGD